MEGPIMNELVIQGEKKSEETESLSENAERAKEIPHLLREGNTKMEAPEDIDFRERENHSEKEKEKEMEKEKENPSSFVDERATEMESANANVEVRDREKKISEERKKETRQDIEREKNIHLDFCREEKTEMEAPANNDQVRGSVTKSEDRENHGERRKDIPPNEMEKEKKIETLPNAEREQDTPPDDDICPICFDKYNIPCKTNCGHWYCANCIIKVWLYKSLFIPCKCPLCNQAIRKLTHDPSLSLRTENEAVEVMLIIRAYNSLSGGGVRSLILKMRLLSRLAPLYFKRFLPYLLPLIFVILILMGIIMVVMLGRFSRGLLNPDKIVANYAIAHIIALGLTLCYNYYGFGFLPGGFLRVNTIFECCTVGLVLVLAAVGLYRRIMNNRRLRPRRRRPRSPPIVEPKPLVTEP